MRFKLQLFVPPSYYNLRTQQIWMLQKVDAVSKYEPGASMLLKVWRENEMNEVITKKKWKKRRYLR